jgi:hypothetical protein
MVMEAKGMPRIGTDEWLSPALAWDRHFIRLRHRPRRLLSPSPRLGAKRFTAGKGIAWIFDSARTTMTAVTGSFFSISY